MWCQIWMCAFQRPFPLYNKMEMLNLEEYQKILAGGHKINHLRYADDAVSIAENEEK